MAQQQDTNQVSISKKSVQSSYESFKQQSTINDDHILRIVHLLGGLDNILEIFLYEDNHIYMTQDQLQQMDQVFANKSQNKPNTLTMLKSLNQNETFSTYDDMRHKFLVSNSYFHAIWGKKFAVHMLEALQKPWSHLVFFVAICIQLFCRFAFRQHIISLLYQLVFLGIGVHFYVVFWLGSANKKGALLVMRTFEFWLKLGYICLFIFVHLYLLFNGIQQNIGYETLHMITSILVYSNGIFVVIIISMFDALYINRTSKALFSGTLAILLSILAVYDKYVTYFNGKQSAVYITNNVSLSLINMQQNAMEILAIFFWKQMIFTILKKDRCVLIKYSPFVEWINDYKNEINVNILNHVYRNSDDNDLSNESQLNVRKYQNKESAPELAMALARTAEGDHANSESVSVSDGNDVSNDNQLSKYQKKEDALEIAIANSHGTTNDVYKGFGI